MTAVPQAVANGPMPYRRRRPERTLLNRTVQAHFATWLALRRDGRDDGAPVSRLCRARGRRDLECGILAHGFARARCGECGHGTAPAMRANLGSTAKKRRGSPAPSTVNRLRWPLYLQRRLVTAANTPANAISASEPGSGNSCCGTTRTVRPVI